MATSNDDLKSRIQALGTEKLQALMAELMKHEGAQEAMRIAFTRLFEAKAQIDKTRGQVLKGLSIPTRSELRHLERQVDQLGKRLAELEGELADAQRTKAPERGRPATAKTPREPGEAKAATGKPKRATAKAPSKRSSGKRSARTPGKRAATKPSTARAEAPAPEPSERASEDGEG